MAMNEDAKVSTITIPINPDLDPATRDDLIRQLAPRDPNLGIVGNYADLQRGGAAAVQGGTVSDGVQPPPGVTDEDIATSQQVNDAIDNANEQADKVTA